MAEKQRFIINGDGTVTDTTTGLIWQQETAGLMTWEAAISYCKGLTVGGYEDWRLPTIQELRLLVDYTRCFPAIDTAAFPGTVSSYYWSSPNVYHTSYVWCVNFGYGHLHDYKSGGYYVRAVRECIDYTSGKDSEHGATLKFISILEKQPEINERILGVNSSGDLFIYIYRPAPYNTLTHWLPLPMSVE